MSSSNSVTITGPRTPHEKAQDPKNNNDQNIQVFIRCRPLDTSRNEKKSVVEIDRLRREVKVLERANSSTQEKSKVFTYDNVFDSSIGQCEVYDHVVAPLINEVLAGYNCTVFAYGQTGTGKTYTMEGERSDFECSWQDDPKAGIVPRALDQLFESLTDSPCESMVAVSYMELYNECLYDLLNPNDDLVKLNIYEDNNSKGKVKVGGLSEITVQKKEEIFDILQKGSTKRQKAATKLNAQSSRSHTIFTVIIRTKDADALMAGEEVYRIGKLNLVDLAGSENIGRSGAVEKRAAEAGNINKSLLTLGRVITSLVEKLSHIPYRESKLTRLLQDSLGGGTKTSIIATISPNILDVEDTLSTLDYAQRAKKITNKPEINQKMAKKTVLRELSAEIERLRRDLEATRCGTNAFMISKENYDSMTVQIDSQGKSLEEKEARIHVLEEEMENVKVLFGETQQKLEEKSQKLAITTETLVKTEEVLKKTEDDLQVTTQDRNEQKCLVSAHVRTEQALKGQAEKLKEVVEITTKHNDKLHSSRDRIKKLDEENLAKVTVTCDKLGNEVGQLKEAVSEKLDKHHFEGIETVLNGQFENVKECIEKTTKQLADGTSSLSSGIMSLSSLGGDEVVISQVQQSIAKSSDLLSSSEDFKETLTHDVKESRQESEMHLNSLINTLSSQKSVLEELLMNHSQTLIQYKQDQAAQLALLESSNSKIFKSQVERNSNIKSEFESLMGQLCKSFESRAARMTEMKTLIEKQVEEDLQSSKLIANGMEKISSFFDANSSSLDEESKSTGRIINSVGKQLEERGKASSSFIDQLDSIISKNQQENVNFVGDVNDKLDGRCESSVANIANVVGDLSSRIEENINQQQETLKSIEAQIQEKRIALNQLQQMHVSNSETLAQDLSSVDQKTRDLYEKVENEIYSSKLHLDSTKKYIAKNLDLLNEQFGNLATKELKKDQPTGETPQKTTFSFPTNLVATSPHERIIQRFRQGIPPDTSLAIVTELPESRSSSSLSSHGSSESINSCGSSTSSKGENKKPSDEIISKIPMKGKTEVPKKIRKNVLRPAN